MFFPRLRRQAKWMFIFLALVFALGFVVYGVGTGQGGLGDIFGGLGGGGGGPSLSKARERTQKNPNNAQAWRDLATALENDNQREAAILPLEQYTRLRPKDADSLGELASLYLGKADRWAGEVQRLQLVELTLGAPGFALDPSSPFGQALTTDPIYTALAAELSQQRNAALAEYSAAAAQGVDVFRRITTLRPDDPQAQLQLADAAERAQSYQVAIDAYKRFLVLAPDSPDAPLIRQRIKELEKLVKSAPPAAG